MKDKFGWYFPLSEDEIKHIWDQAILTVDANVLLDLYRYHEDTRSALLEALQKFQGRAWLSHQTTEEFFRNRKKVIISAINSYDDANKNLSDIKTGAEEPLNRLRSNRIIPDQIEERLRTALKSALKTAQTSITEAKEEHPNFLEADPILEKLVALFDKSVGDGFSGEQLEEAKKEGKRRLESKTPPGFLDSKKDGTRPYGDYYMWRQILEYAANEKKPVIFVTSEGKEDWWEKASGQTIGLHYELLKEAFDKTGQRLLAYRTDRFFRFSSEVIGEESNESAAEEISALVEERAATTPLLRIVSQIEARANQTVNTGKLVVELLKPVYMFTCSGHLEPNLNDIPEVNVRLINHPDEMPSHFVRSGAGTTFDFNVHVKSIAYEEQLPVGEYEFDYEASIQDLSNVCQVEGEI